MLQAMGLRVWAPAVAAGLADVDAPADSGADVADTAPRVTSVRDARPDRRPDPPPDTAQAPAAALAVPAGPTGPPPMPDDAQARAARIATLDWPALREAVAGCQACGLCAGRRQTVFGAGGTRAHWMVVGEAPGEQEDKLGEPFVGPAGRLLDQMLAALGLSRDADATDPARQVYIANTLKCRPPGNRNPAPDEMARCEPFLQRQIALLRPRIILAMGRFAVQSLLRTNEAIGRLRGRVHAYQGVPLVVTYHPAYLLRNLPDKARAWQDLCLAADTVDAAGTEPAADDTRHDAERR
jgi:DNA polymerase